MNDVPAMAERRITLPVAVCVEGWWDTPTLLSSESSRRLHVKSWCAYDVWLKSDRESQA